MTFVNMPDKFRFNKFNLDIQVLNNYVELISFKYNRI